MTSYNDYGIRDEALKNWRCSVMNIGNYVRCVPRVWLVLLFLAGLWLLQSQDAGRVVLFLIVAALAAFYTLKGTRPKKKSS